MCLERSLGPIAASMPVEKAENETRVPTTSKTMDFFLVEAMVAVWVWMWVWNREGGTEVYGCCWRDGNDSGWKRSF